MYCHTAGYTDASMGFSDRIFLLDVDDTLYRVPAARFDRMLRAPADHRVHQFAGMRVRMAACTVELVDGEPAAVVQAAYSMLSFDADGRLDVAALKQHQAARVDLLLGSVIGRPERKGKTVEAASRFLAQGAAWKPSPSLARRIAAAALGELNCSRLPPGG